MTNKSNDPCDGCQMPYLKREIGMPSKLFRGLKRLTAGLWNPSANLGRTRLPAEVESLNLGKRAQSNGLYSPADVNEAVERYGANCGPASFAAINRRPVSDVMVFFGHFPDKPWTTKGQMRAALKSADLKWRECGPNLPNFLQRDEQL